MNKVVYRHTGIGEKIRWFLGRNSLLYVKDCPDFKYRHNANYLTKFVMHYLKQWYNDTKIIFFQMQYKLRGMMNTMRTPRLSTYICPDTLLFSTVWKKDNAPFVLYAPCPIWTIQICYSIVACICQDNVRSGASKGCVFSIILKGRTTLACRSLRSHMQIVPSRAPVAKRSAICNYL